MTMVFEEKGEIIKLSSEIQKIRDVILEPKLSNSEKKNQKQR